MNREEASFILANIDRRVCDDELNEALDMAIKALDQEPCDNAVSRQDVLDLAKKGILISNGNYKSVRKAINELPSVNPQPCQEKWIDEDDNRYICKECEYAHINPTKTGHWIEHPEIETSTPEYLMFYKCSECGDKQCFCKSDIHKKRFCNNCGAKMVEPQESERTL